LIYCSRERGMTLQRKFAVLLMFLGAIVAVNVGIAAWSISFLERNLAEPLAAIAPVLSALQNIKSEVEARGGMLPGAERDPPSLPEHGSGAGADPPPGDSRTPFAVLKARTEEAMERLGRTDDYRMRAGTTLRSNLQGRLNHADAAFERWMSAQQEARAEDARAAAAEASDGYLRIRQLIERAEATIVTNAGADLAWAAVLRSNLILILASSLLLVGLAATLATIIVRRLVVNRVGALRDAAGRLAMGDFSHRLPVTGADELAMLSAEVNHMASMIAAMQEERVDRERLAAVGEMVRRIAHNLRNPLAGIRSLAELTRSDLPVTSPSHENQSRIVRTVDRFESWLSDLLRVSTPPKLNPASTAVRPWLDASIEPLRPLAEAKEVSLCVESSSAPDRVSMDPRHMEQVVVSLVTNAIQASPPGSTVTISTVCHNGEYWEVRVRDQGPGVPTNIRGEVFRPYFTTKAGGTGIGLAAAKQVVEQHGGRIWIEDGPGGPQESQKTGRGAVFVARLPLDMGPQLANTGQVGRTAGDSCGQDTDRRRRGEPAVFDPAGADPSGP
jgi:signal transduction histidine kinase